MKGRICYDCERKTECFTEQGLVQLKPGETYKDITGCECGAVFTNYEEMREFVYKIGEVINQQRTSDHIIKLIAEKCGVSPYFVRLEFEREC